MTNEEAIEVLKQKGWCYSHTHPYSGAFDQIMVGPRGDSENYGSFPAGWVSAVYAYGDSLDQAVRLALEYEKRKEESAIEKAIELEVDASIETEREDQ